MMEDYETLDLLSQNITRHFEYTEHQDPDGTIYLIAKITIDRETVIFKRLDANARSLSNLAGSVFLLKQYRNQKTPELKKRFGRSFVTGGK